MSMYWKIFSLLSVAHLCLVYRGVILIIFFLQFAQVSFFLFVEFLFLYNSSG